MVQVAQGAARNLDNGLLTEDERNRDSEGEEGISRCGRATEMFAKMGALTPNCKFRQDMRKEEGQEVARRRLVGVTGMPVKHGKLLVADHQRRGLTFVLA